MNVLVRMRSSQARMLVPASNWSRARMALSKVSCTKSWASAGFRVRRDATPKSALNCAMAWVSNSRAEMLTLRLIGFPEATRPVPRLFPILGRFPLAALEALEPLGEALDLEFELAKSREIRQNR